MWGFQLLAQQRLENMRDQFLVFNQASNGWKNTFERSEGPERVWNQSNLQKEQTGVLGG